MMRGHCSGTMSPPSGARPSSRMSAKDCDAAWPRVLTYFTGGGNPPHTRSSQQFFQPYANHRCRNGRERLDAPDRGAHVLLERAVGEEDHVDLVLALARFLLEDRV